MARQSKAATESTTPANLRIWSQIAVTPPERTKDFSRGGGFKGTAINPTYVAERLTELFGPCGEGWRFILCEEYYEEGHTLSNGDRCKIHVVRGHLEFKTSAGGDWNRTGQQFGQTTFVGENRSGPFTDEEAPKKSITDCMTKLAAMLGMSADIFSGKWDANKYVNEPAGVLAVPKKAAGTVPKKKAAAVDAAVVSLAESPASDWSPIDWAGRLAETDNPESVLADLSLLRSFGASATEDHFAVFADWLRARNQLVLQPGGKAILAELKEARAALDGETTAAPAAVPKKKPVKKKVA